MFVCVYDEEFLNALAGCVSNYPSYDNYVMTASALLRLQDVYDLETTHLASGLVGSSTANSPSMSGKSQTPLRYLVRSWLRTCSELVRSWFAAEIWPIIQLASSELARASRFAAKFHYASWLGAGSEHVRS